MSETEAAEELPVWEKPKTIEMELEELESFADLDIIFAMTTTGCDIIPTGICA